MTLENASLKYSFEMTAENSSLPDKFLQQNCRENWPRWTCVFGNVCGLCSAALWFIVLLPQVWKNFRRKSVKGLSVLWATANFTASLINLCFVFMYAHIPLYGQIGSVYSPILEFTLLVQFWMYGRNGRKEKMIYAVCCFVIWAVVITIELVFQIKQFVEYAAIVLWCVETFPQVLLNMKLQSTAGQATGSVVIAMIGKTTDFFANNILVLPMQYVIMCYFSSSVAYVNGFQVAWYYGNTIMTSTHDDNESRNIKEENGHFPNSFTSHETDFAASVNTTSMTELTSSRQIISPKFVYAIRIICMCVISCLLLMCVVGFVLNVKSFLGLLAPFAIGVVLMTANLYFRRFKRTSYSFQ